MKRLIAAGMATAGVLAISACGGGGGGSTSSAAGPAGADTVSVQQVSGVGRVLVDQSGKALYSPDQEANGKILCSSGCTAFWKPVEPGGAKPTAPSGAGKLGVIKRPDGKMQLTANGKPLYTFSEDSPGKATGDGFKDDFNGHHFAWHVVHSGGKTSTGGAGGAPSNSGGSGGGYGY